MTVTFFGHRDAPQEILPHLQEVIARLIAQGADTFYVGDHGDFDRMVLTELTALKAQHPSIRCAVALAYLPRAPLAYDTVYPEGLERVPPRYAIDARNRWMLAQADVVVTYVCRPYGGAAKFAALARQQGRRVIEMAE